MSEATDIIERLDDDPDVDAEFEEIAERVDEELEDIIANQTSAMDPDELEEWAAITVQNELKNLSSGGSFGGGDIEEVPILSLGYRCREGEYFVTTGDGLVVGALVNPPEKDPGVCVIVVDESHGVDLEYARECFNPLNTVRGHIALREVGSWENEMAIKKGGFPTYVANSTEETKLEVAEPDQVDDDDPIAELPRNREEKRTLINETFFGKDEVFDLQTYPDVVSVMNDNGYPIAFGVDMYRIRAKVQDAVVFEGGDGFMTVTDNTIYEPDDIDPDLIGDKMRTPGLQVSAFEDSIFGEGSLLDIYGYIQQRDDGQFRMNALGVIPISPVEYDGGVVGSSDNQTEDEFEEDEI